MLEVLLVLFIATVIVTVVGHAIWCLVAIFVRAVFSTKGSPSDGRCSHCGQIRPGTVSSSIKGSSTPPQLPHAVARPSRPVLHGRERQAGETGPVSTATAVTDTDLIDASGIIEAEIVSEPPAPVKLPERQQPTHPLDQVQVGDRERQPRSSQPRRTLADWLQAFMEEKNIRWGELLSGFLIVGSAVGLIISLRHTLSNAIPYFPALLFMLGTAAIHAAGNYTLRRWKLSSTSRGVLLIATLLIPLNFLAAIVMSNIGARQLPVHDPRYLIAVCVGLLSFGAMAYFASRTLMRDGWWRLWVAVMGTSAGQLLINRLAGPGMSSIGILGLSLLPATAFFAATGHQLWRARNWGRLTSARAEQLMILLGVATFSLAPVFALLVHKSSGLVEVLPAISPLATALGTLLLSYGLLIHLRAVSIRLAKVKTAGTTLAIVAGIALAGSVAFAWPEPIMLLAVGLTLFATLTCVALVGRLPWLHAGAVAGGALSALVGVHWTAGHLLARGSYARVLLASCLTDETSVTLTVLAILVGAVGWWSGRVSRRAESLVYLWSSASLAGLGVAAAAAASLSAWPLPSYPLATPVFLVNAVALLLAARYLRLRGIAWCGSALLLAGCVHAVTLNAPAQAVLSQLGIPLVRPVVFATLVHAIATTTIAAAIWRRSGLRDEAVCNADRQRFALPLLNSAVVSATATLPFVVLVAGGHFGIHAMYLTVVAAVWLTASVITRSRPLFTVFQTLSAGIVVLFMCWLGVRFQWWDVRVTSVSLLSVQLSALAAWCMIWFFVRGRYGRSVHGSQMLGTSVVTVERVLLRALTVCIISLAVLSCLSSLANELGESWPVASWDAEFSAGYLPLGISFGCVFAATLLAMIRRPTTADVNWLVAIVFAVPWLCVSQKTEAGNTTVLLNSSMAVIGLLLSVAYAYRQRLLQFALKRMQWDTTRLAAGSSLSIRRVILSFSMIPLSLLTICQFGIVLTGGTPEHVFLSIAAPLFVATLMFIVLAMSDAKSWLMLCGSASMLTGVVLGCVSHALVQQSFVDLPGLIGIVQWSTIAMAAYSIVWLGLQRIRRTLGRLARETLLSYQIAASVGFLSTIIAGALIGIVASPADLPPVVGILGQPLSYVALATVVAALTVGQTSISFEVYREELATDTDVRPTGQGGFGARQFWIHTGGAAGVALATLIAASLAPINTGDHLISYHVLEAASVLIAAIAAIGLGLYGRASAARQRAGDLLTLWGSAAVLSAALLALRVYSIEPQVVWSLIVLAICTSITIAIGLVRGSTPHAMASLLQTALTITLGLKADGRSTPMDVVLLWNVVGLSLTASVWLASTIWHQRRGGEARGAAAGVHEFTLLFGCVLVTLLAIFGFLVPKAGLELDVLLPGLVALICLSGLAAFSHWDRRSTSPLPCLYTLGFAALFFSLDHLQAFDGEWTTKLAGWDVGAAVLVAFTGWLLGKRTQLSSLAAAIHIPSSGRHGERAQAWLPTANLILSIAAVLLSLMIVCFFELRPLRFAAASAPLICGLGFVFTARQVRDGRIRFIAMLLMAFSIVLVAWADMAPQRDASSLLERCVRLLISLSATASLFPIAARRLSERSAAWQETLYKTATLAGGGAVLTLLLVLGVELAAFVPGQGVPVSHPYQIIAVAIALAGLIVALVAMAIRPVHDPLELSERGRMFYVYAAEAVAALFFAHMYLVKPMWFESVHVRYWPFGLMALAFAGVGVGELCQRMKLNVLAEPLRRTAAFLPLLPVAAFWVLAGNQRLSFQATGISYAAVLVVVGLLYVTLSLLRQSLASAVAAAVAGNAAMWVFFHDNSFHIAQHPQFWLIPPALSLLVASHINRLSLPTSALTAIRYGCILLIYLSSTAEMIIESASQQLWPPMVLAALALIGAFAGIVMRVRAFLYIGSTFVLLSVVSMVWHAARAIEHVWPWWAFGMATGLFILSLFGFFELKRAEVTRLIDRLRQWER